MTRHSNKTIKRNSNFVINNFWHHLQMWGAKEQREWVGEGGNHSSRNNLLWDYFVCRFFFINERDFSSLFPFDGIFYPSFKSLKANVASWWWWKLSTILTLIQWASLKSDTSTFFLKITSISHFSFYVCYLLHPVSYQKRQVTAAGNVSLSMYTHLPCYRGISIKNHFHTSSSTLYSKEEWTSLSLSLGIPFNVDFKITFFPFFLFFSFLFVFHLFSRHHLFTLRLGVCVGGR